MAPSDGNTDPTVDEAVEALSGDWRRKGKLETKDIERIAEKRRLNPTQLNAMLAQLSAIGIVAVDPINNTTFVGDRSGNVEPRPGDLLTREEERELANAIRLGVRLEETQEASQDAQKYIERGHRARDEFISRNLKLVHWVARSFCYTSLEYEDLVQEGCKGLMTAVDMFDPNLGYKFSTYATWWIRQAIRRAIDDTALLIRIPVHRLESVRRLRRMKRRLEAELGYEPSAARLAEALDWSVEKTAFLADLARMKTVSLDAPVADDSNMTIADSLPDTHQPSPEQHMIEESLRSFLDRLIADLPNERMRDVIEKRMGIGTNERTLQEIGEEYGLTRERIRQIEAKALKFLSRPSRCRSLRIYVE